MPHVPPQPSGPHVLPLHDGTHAHVPEGVHVSVAAHEPHEPPHPSGPHVFPVHEGTHTHAPVSLHVVGESVQHEYVALPKESPPQAFSKTMFVTV